MHFDEQTLGQYRVYAAAQPVEGVGGPQGFCAAVVVRQHGLMGGGRETFRDELLDDGAVFPDPQGALRAALTLGEAAVRAQLRLAAYQATQLGQ